MQMMRRDFGGKVKNLRRRRKMGGEMRGKLEKLTGRTEVQIESARNGRRDSLMKSRGRDTLIQRSQKCDRDAKYGSVE